MGKLTLRLISDRSEFASMHDVWNTLLKKSSADTVFLTWEWMYTWWECFGENKKLFIVVGEDDGVIVGIAPLQISRVNFFGISTLTHLEFLGTSGIITEYPDLIIQQGLEEAFVPLFIEFIYRQSTKWDVLNLVSMKQDATNLKLIEESLEKHGAKYFKYDSRISPYIELPESMEEYLKTLSNKSRWKFKDYRKKLQNGRTVELSETKTKDALADDLSAIMDLHQKRWEKKGGPGSFAQSRIRFLRFHNNVAQRFFDSGWLYLLRLIVDNIIVAGHYSFYYNNKVYCHSVGFNPDWAEYNVGSVLQLLSIEDSIRKGAKEFDFLRGTEQYKYYWTKKERHSVDIAVWRSTAVEHRVVAERKLRKFVKALFPRGIVEKFYQYIINRNE